MPQLSWQGVAVTACILSYAIWTSLDWIGPVRTPMTILENNCLPSTASSAGYSAAASSSADLLTDLKSDYLLGANPRKQFVTQLAGIFVGTVVTVLSFRLLVRTRAYSAPTSFRRRSLGSS